MKSYIIILVVMLVTVSLINCEKTDLKTLVKDLIKQETKSLRSELKQLERKYQQLEKYISARLNVDYSFTAVLTQATEYTQNETIVFDDVITNINDNYDVITGIYTCPLSGLYEFSYSVATISNQGESVYTSMYRNDNLLVSASVWDSDGRAKMGSNRVFTQCEAGDEVHIRAGEFDGNPISLLAGDLNHCTFSGTFLGA